MTPNLTFSNSKPHKDLDSNSGPRRGNSLRGMKWRDSDKEDIPMTLMDRVTSTSHLQSTTITLNSGTIKSRSKVTILS